MKSYRQTLEFLYGLQNRGMKFGLQNTRFLLRSLGNPERAFRSIHVAGTNGKGSTASFLASIFTEAGYNTALYTSPHLVRFTERIRIDGKEIPESRLVEYAAQLRPMIERTHATFFEATTCIAFQFFADEGVDIAIVEAGLGGRLDSTNVLRPLVSVITNVAFDHVEYLGTTLKSIAREKGGIIKQGVLCVTASDNQEVLSTLRGIAKRRNSRLVEARRHVTFKSVESRRNKEILHIQSKNIVIRGVHLGLSGQHQVTNALTAVATLNGLLERVTTRRIFPSLDSSAVKNGLEKVEKNSGIHGRLESLGNERRFLLDVAHNPNGMKTLAASLSSLTKKNLVVVFGVVKDKDYSTMCESVAEIAKHVVAVQPKNPRALKSSEILKLFNQRGKRATDGRSVRRGVEIAKKLAGKNGKVLITGSHYVVGEAVEFLRNEG